MTSLSGRSSIGIGATNAGSSNSAPDRESSASVYDAEPKVSGPPQLNRILIFLLAVVVIGLTLPRFVINYGMDGDGIRGMMAAEHLVATGSYEPSRLPGNPLFEYILAGASLVDGYYVTNGLVLLSFVICIWAFFLLTEGREERSLLVSLFALTPILLVNAAVTMDYLPGLAAILWSAVAAERKNPISAYLLMGLAMGFRLSAGAFVVPLSLCLLLLGVPFLRIVAGSVFGILVGLAFYLPILMHHGLAVFSIPPHAYHGLGYIMFSGYKMVMVFGPLATAGVVLLLLSDVRGVVAKTRADLKALDPAFVLELTSVAVFTVVFLRHSDESEYLIPAVPFVYLLLSRWLDRKRLLILTVLVVSFAFVSVELKGGESGRRHMTLRPAWGIVAKDFLDRKELEALRQGIARFDKSDKAVILTGYGPMLGYGNPGLVKAGYREISPGLDEKGISEEDLIVRIPHHQVFLVNGLSKENVDVLRKEGYVVYYLSESAPSHALHSWGYDPRKIGLERLDILNEQAFYRQPYSQSGRPGSDHCGKEAMNREGTN